MDVNLVEELFTTSCHFAQGLFTTSCHSFTGLSQALFTTSSDLVQDLHAVDSVVWYKDYVCILGAGQLHVLRKVGMWWRRMCQPGLYII